MNPADFDELFARIPPLAERAPAEFTITALAGLTNQNFRLRAADADWVLRIPQPQTGRFIDRGAEQHNQQIVATLGIAPLWAWRDDSGLALTPTKSGRSPVQADFDEPEFIDRIAQLIGQLHGCGHEFRGQVDPGELIERYFALLPGQRQLDFARRRRESRRWLAEIRAFDHPPVPSHNDLVLENLLLEADGICLIDWEFSAMASPYWDLATIANAAELDSSACSRLLDIYCAVAGPMKESVFNAYRNLLALLGDCWMAALIQR